MFLRPFLSSILCVICQWNVISAQTVIVEFKRSLLYHENVQEDKPFTYAGLAGGQLQQKVLKATAEAGRHPWEQELLHLAPETKLWAVLECTSWEGIY